MGNLYTREEKGLGGLCKKKKSVLECLKKKGGKEINSNSKNDNRVGGILLYWVMFFLALVCV
jgi:hypothetical protein